MKFKVATMALLLCAVAFCSESDAQLLDRMLNRGGCGVASSCCDTPSSACGEQQCRNFSLITLNFNRGCGGGCGLFNGGGLGLFNGGGCGSGCGLFSGGLFNNGGCDTGCDSGCGSQIGVVGGCDDSCGGTCGGRLFNGGLLSRLGSCGCTDRTFFRPALFQRGSSCGCDAPAVSACDDGCGGGRLRGLLSGFRSRLGSCGGCGALAGQGCGCEAAPAPCAPVADCGPRQPLLPRPLFNRCGSSCDTGCEAVSPCDDGCSGPRFRLFQRLGSIGSCGQAADCGCEAPVASCNTCETSACGGGFSLPKLRLFQRLGSCGQADDCGCAAPVASTCDAGCDTGCGSNRLSLLDRLRGRRTPSANGCNDGCNSPCPTNNCGAVAAPAGCNSCGSSVIESAPTYDSQVPSAVPAADPANAIEAAPEANQGAHSVPNVDPSAFILRGTKARYSN